MSDWDIATPYTAVYALLYKDGKLAFVLRSHTGWMDGKYGLPAGRVEKGESLLQATVREAQEEVGVTIQIKDLTHRLTMHRYSDDDKTLWVDAYFEAASWTGDVINAEPDKHGEVAWLDPTKLPDNVVPPVRAALEAIAAGQTYAEYGWDS